MRPVSINAPAPKLAALERERAASIRLANPQPVRAADDRYGIGSRLSDALRNRKGEHRSNRHELDESHDAPTSPPIKLQELYLSLLLWL